MTETEKTQDSLERHPCRHVREEGDEVYHQVGLLDLCEYCYDNYQEAKWEAGR